MRKTTVLFFLFFLFVSSCISGPVMADDRVLAVKEALARFICYTDFWYADMDVEGAPLDFELKFEGDKFYIWVNDEKLRSSRKGAQFIGIYEGSIKNGKGMIESGMTYNIKQSRTLPQQFAEHRRHFETGPIIKTSMVVPKDCTPRYDPMTPRKEVLIDAIAKTIQKMLRRYAAEGRRVYPERMTLLIANFNLDYQFTFVIVEPINAVYSVALHDWDDYQGDEYGRDGEVLTGERTMDVFSKETLREVRRHGIVREITIR